MKTYENYPHVYATDSECPYTIVDYSEVPQSVVKADTADTKEVGNAYIAALTEFAETKAQKQYFLKNYICAVKIGDKFLLIEKPKIKTNFCFRDEGAAYEQYQELSADAEKMKKYFVSENLKRFSSYINAVDKGENLYLDDCYNDNSIAVHTYCARDMPKVDAETCMAIKEACEYAKATTITRLNTYLKKYGISKLNVWTYWANR